jgi:hypothetical protein
VSTGVPGDFNDQQLLPLTNFPNQDALFIAFIVLKQHSLTLGSHIPNPMQAVMYEAVMH